MRRAGEAEQARYDAAVAACPARVRSAPVEGLSAAACHALLGERLGGYADVHPPLHYKGRDQADANTWRRLTAAALGTEDEAEPVELVRAWMLSGAPRALGGEEEKEASNAERQAPRPASPPPPTPAASEAAAEARRAAAARDAAAEERSAAEADEAKAAAEVTAAERAAAEALTEQRRQASLASADLEATADAELAEAMKAVRLGQERVALRKAQAEKDRASLQEAQAASAPLAPSLADAALIAPGSSSVAELLQQLLDQQRLSTERERRMQQQMADLQAQILRQGQVQGPGSRPQPSGADVEVLEGPSRESAAERRQQMQQQLEGRQGTSNHSRSLADLLASQSPSIDAAADTGGGGAAGRTPHEPSRGGGERGGRGARSGDYEVGPRDGRAPASCIGLPGETGQGRTRATSRVIQIAGTYSGANIGAASTPARVTLVEKLNVVHTAHGTGEETSPEMAVHLTRRGDGWPGISANLAHLICFNAGTANGQPLPLRLGNFLAESHRLERISAISRGSKSGFDADRWTYADVPFTPVNTLADFHDAAQCAENVLGRFSRAYGDAIRVWRAKVNGYSGFPCRANDAEYLDMLTDLNFERIATNALGVCLKLTNHAWAMARRGGSNAAADLARSYTIEPGAFILDSGYNVDLISCLNAMALGDAARDVACRHADPQWVPLRGPRVLRSLRPASEFPKGPVAGPGSKRARLCLHFLLGRESCGDGEPCPNHLSHTPMSAAERRLWSGHV